MKLNHIAIGRLTQKTVAAIVLFSMLAAMICGMLPSMTAYAETTYTDALRSIEGRIFRHKPMGAARWGLFVIFDNGCRRC